MTGQQTCRIYLHDGAILEFQAGDVTVAVATATNALRRIEWKDADRAPLYLDLSKVIAVQMVEA